MNKFKSLLAVVLFLAVAFIQLMSTSVGIWIAGYVLAVATIIVIGMAGELNKIILEIKRAKIVR